MDYNKQLQRILSNDNNYKILINVIQEKLKKEYEYNRVEFYVTNLKESKENVECELTTIFECEKGIIKQIYPLTFKSLVEFKEASFEQTSFFVSTVLAFLINKD
tara:strand:- start:2652 stop:2963 length:312 start_codon:yes stop_codon:yes gene_type:complete